MLTRTVRWFLLVAALLALLIVIPFSQAQADPTPTPGGDQTFVGAGSTDDVLGADVEAVPSEPAPGTSGEASVEVTQEAVPDGTTIINNTFISGDEAGSDTTTSADTGDPIPDSGLSFSFTTGEIILLVVLFVVFIAIVVGVPLGVLTYLSKNHAETLRQTPRFVSDGLATTVERGWTDQVDARVKRSTNDLDNLIEQKVSEGVESFSNKLLELMGSDRRIDITDHNNAVTALNDATAEMQSAKHTMQELIDQQRTFTAQYVPKAPSEEAIPQN